MSEHMTDDEILEAKFEDEVDWAIFKGLLLATRMIHSEGTKCAECPHLSPVFGDGKTVCTVFTPCIHIRDALERKYKN